MRTCLYSTSLLDGNDFYGTDRLKRTTRWLDWYLKIKEQMGFDDIVLADNASDPERVKALNKYPLTIYNQPRLEREKPLGEKPHDYPFCWRGIYFMRELINSGYTKIINIDTDGFILNSKTTQKVKECNSGWVAWTPKEFYFPENALNILNEDAFHVLKLFTSVPMETHFGKILELEVPFTQVRKDINTFRWGQEFIPQTKEMDFYCQSNDKVTLTYDI